MIVAKTFDISSASFNKVSTFFNPRPSLNKQIQYLVSFADFQGNLIKFNKVSFRMS